jgi:DNA-binding transcriptional MocR family regulator
MPPAQVPFTRGVPAADLIPVSDMRTATMHALDADPIAALSYAPGGFRPLREWIGARHGVDAGRVLITNGSLQALGFLGQHFYGADGGAAVVEAPTYDRTLKILRAAGADIHSVPLAADGIDVDRLAEMLAGGLRPHLVYVIPTYQNPSGACASLARRRALLDLAREHDLLLVEDDPYGLLRFEGDRVPTLHELDGGERVIYCSSFTKTIAPGVRTGYLVVPEPLVAPLAVLSENTHIGPNTLAEAVVWAYCDAGRFEPNVARATAGLRARRDAMEAALREHFPAGSQWTTPKGGYFFWVDLPDGIDTSDALAAAAEQGVPYVKGADFFASEGGRSSLRLAFSACATDQIGEGIGRLAQVLAARRATAVA